jgi:hypothetical protein
MSTNREYYACTYTLMIWYTGARISLGISTTATSPFVRRKVEFHLSSSDTTR